jgi:hypothetical protein
MVDLLSARALRSTDLPGWVPCTKAMPDSDQTVLISNIAWDEPTWMGFHDGEVWRDIEAFICDPAPTHWMPMPSPAEGDGGNDAR